MMLAATLVATTSPGAFAAALKSKTASVQSPESIECSKQADAKGLHGKERVKFRAQCKKDLKSKSTASISATTTTSSATPPAADKSTEKSAPVKADTSTASNKN